ncbi:MAG: virulence RhuM family protein [bacterium]|nr:virulence RhuM family protein [bacterium]
MGSEVEFHGVKLQIVNDDYLATRQDLMKLYQVPRKTLSDNILKLKEDGLVHGAEIRHMGSNGQWYTSEAFNGDEIIAIGFRLRSPVAIEFQRYAISVVKNDLMRLQEQYEQQKQELETKNEKLFYQQKFLDHYWDEQDRNDLYIKRPQ